MGLEAMKKYLAIFSQAPEGIKDVLFAAFWFLVLVVIISKILKHLFSNDFIRLYNLIGLVLKLLGTFSKRALSSAVSNIQFPEPYPRAKRVFEIIFMVNSYLATILFSALAVLYLVLLITASSIQAWQVIVALLLVFVFAYFAIFSLAQAEQDRVRLFKDRK